jgi:hypothetical protein
MLKEYICGKCKTEFKTAKAQRLHVTHCEVHMISKSSRMKTKPRRFADYEAHSTSGDDDGAGRILDDESEARSETDSTQEGDDIDRGLQPSSEPESCTEEDDVDTRGGPNADHSSTSFFSCVGLHEVR